ncbi:hypothetical protein QFZ79_001198 [Arthrobacter sp. V4I6]|nr:hypothetical protein [Arthrobacter sp. V4I6]
MPACGDQVLRLGHFVAGAAHVNGAGVGKPRGSPGHRAGEDEVDLAGAISEAERLEGPPVPVGESSGRQPEQSGRCDVQQGGPDRGKLCQGVDPRLRFHHAAVGLEVRDHGLGDGC